MILQLLFALVFAVISLLFSFLPSGSVLPWGTDAVLVTAIGWVRSFLSDFWPAQIILTVVLLYLGFRLVMMLVKLFIGHRAPVN